MRRSHQLYGPPSKMAREARSWFNFFYRAVEPDFTDAPHLPVTEQDQFWLMSMQAGPLGYLIGRYAASLKAHGHDLHHPLPPDYIRGAMACSSLPEQVRMDPEMLRRFPPKKLEGLDEATLVWAPSGSSGQNLAA